jgi:citrate lyase beta subunit
MRLRSVLFTPVDDERKLSGVVAHEGRMVDLPVVEQVRQALADRDKGAS